MNPWRTLRIDQRVTRTDRLLGGEDQFAKRDGGVGGDSLLLTEMHDGLRRLHLRLAQAQELARVAVDRQIFAKVSRSGMCPFSTRESVAELTPTSAAAARTPRPPRLMAIKRPSSSIGNGIKPHVLKAPLADSEGTD